MKDHVIRDHVIEGTRERGFGDTVPSFWERENGSSGISFQRSVRIALVYRDLLLP